MYRGTIKDIGIEPSYYQINRYIDEDSYTVSYVDANGISQSTARWEYAGTRFTDVYVSKSYFMLVKGYNKKEKELEEYFFLTLDEYNSFDKGDKITVRIKKTKWYHMDEVLFSTRRINKHIKTGRTKYISSGSRGISERRFVNNYLPYWKLERKNDRF
jgi:hypothetical protein